MKYNTIMLDVFELECKLFMKMDSYNLIEKKCNKKCLNQDEKQQLNMDVQYAFAKLIKTIKETCPRLTNEDVIFCCLTKSGLDTMIICHCMGSFSLQTANQRKYRIKKKMKESKCGFLFDLIFTSG